MVRHHVFWLVLLLNVFLSFFKVEMWELFSLIHTKCPWMSVLHGNRRVCSCIKLPWRCYQWNWAATKLHHSTSRFLAGLPWEIVLLPSSWKVLYKDKKTGWIWREVSYFNYHLSVLMHQIWRVVTCVNLVLLLVKRPFKTHPSYGDVLKFNSGSIQYVFISDSIFTK